VSENKRIAKNTLFLYIRMILIMGVSLYTSRVVLDKLGRIDYGLYSVVGGVVGMLSFLNGTLSIGTSRFLTYELGRGDTNRLQITFSTAFYTHLILAVFVLLFMETVGMWFLYNKLVIPIDRIDACVLVFQLSILTTLISIIQVPYTSLIVAHEKMEVYAYISVFEAVAKLLICYLITITYFDKLVIYAILLTIVQLIVSICYYSFSVIKFRESHLKLNFENSILRNMMGFSGWNILANISETLKQQGVIVLMNMFFAPIVAAQAIANQVTNAMMQFVNSFRTAINPAIIKLYAAGNYDASKKMTLATTVYCFDLVLFLGLPAIFVMNELLHLWLVEVPEYTLIFIRWMIVCQIINTFSASFYIPMMAANKMRSNSIAAVFIGIGQFVVLYILLKLGNGVMWVQYMHLIATILFALFVKPYILYKQIDYKLSELLKCYWSCAKVLLLSLGISVTLCYSLESGIWETIFKVVIVASSVLLSSFIFLERDIKEKFLLYIKSNYARYVK